MTLTRQQVIAIGAVLLLMLALGVFFLVRLEMAASSKATTPTDNNGSAIADSPGTYSQGDHPAPRTNSNPIITGPPGTNDHPAPGTNSRPTITGSPDIDDEGDHPASGANSDPAVADNSRTNPGTPPPHPAVLVSPSVFLHAQVPRGEDGRDLVLKGGEVANIDVAQDFRFSIPARVIDISFKEYVSPGEENSAGALAFSAPVAGEHVRECQRDVVALPSEGGLVYLCTVGIRMSESAKSGSNGSLYGYSGTVNFVFEATCNARTGKPCESLPEHYAPSLAEPIDVRFICEFQVSFSK